MVALRKISPGPMTVGEFLDWDGGKNRRWELRDGVPAAMAPASDDHGAIQAELARLIGNHFTTRPGACRVIANQAWSHAFARVSTPAFPISP